MILELLILAVLGNLSLSTVLTWKLLVYRGVIQNLCHEHAQLIELATRPQGPKDVFMETGQYFTTDAEAASQERHLKAESLQRTLANGNAVFSGR